LNGELADYSGCSEEFGCAEGGDDDGRKFG
jgi:hypothetical protein